MGDADPSRCGAIEVPACHVGDLLAHTNDHDRAQLERLPAHRMCAAFYERTPDGSTNACTHRTIRAFSSCKRGDACEPQPVLPSEHFEWRFATLKDAPDDVRRFYGLYLRGEFAENKKSAIASTLWNDMEAHRIDEVYSELSRTLRRFPRELRSAVNSSTRVLPAVQVEWSIESSWLGRKYCQVRVPNNRDLAFHDDEPPRSSSAYGWQVCEVFVHRKGSNAPGHGLMLAAHSGRVYAYDPNGQEIHTGYDGSFDVDEATDTASTVVVLLALDAARRHMRWGGGWRSNWYTRAEHWLLDVGMGQSGVIRYLDSGGICGAFVWYVMSLLVLNPSCTAEALARFLSYRQSQWQDEAVSDDRLKTTLQKLRTWQPGELSGITLQMMSLQKLLHSDHARCFTQVMDAEMARLSETMDATIARMAKEEAAHKEALEAEGGGTTASVGAYNAFVDKHNADVRQHEQMRLRYNELAHSANDVTEVENVLPMIEDCDDVADRLHRWVYDTAWWLLKQMKIEPDTRTRVRQKMVQNGIFLNFLEVQIFSFITYCAELQSATTKSATN